MQGRKYLQPFAGEVYAIDFLTLEYMGDEPLQYVGGRYSEDDYPYGAVVHTHSQEQFVFLRGATLVGLLKGTRAELDALGIEPEIKMGDVVRFLFDQERLQYGQTSSH